MNNYSNIAKVLETYKKQPEFIKDWCNSIGWESLNNVTNDEFLLILQKDIVKKLLNGDQNRWLALYNLTCDLDLPKNYINDNNSVIYNPNLYRVKDTSDFNKLVKYDIDNMGNAQNKSNLEQALKNGTYGVITQKTKTTNTLQDVLSNFYRLSDEDQKLFKAAVNKE